MKNTIIQLLFLGLFLPFNTVFAQNTQPKTPFSGKISFQGKLEQDGKPYQGTAHIEFRIGGWQESQNVLVQKGLYAAVLGAITPIPDTLFERANELKLEIRVNNQRLQPDVQLFPVPFAYKAKTLPPNTVDGNMIQSKAIQGRHLADSAITLSNLALGSINSAAIQNGSILPEDLASGGKRRILVTDTAGKVFWQKDTVFQPSNLEFGKIWLGDRKNMTKAVTIQGDVSMNENGFVTIRAGAIQASSIALYSIQNSNLAQNSIFSYNIVNGSVLTEDLASGGADKVLTTNTAGQVIWENKLDFFSVGSYWNRFGNRMSPANLSDNIGIGLNNPAERLEVAGGIKIGLSPNNTIGTLQWNGGDFQGNYPTVGWRNFTNVAGSPATGSVAFWNGGSSLSGNGNFMWDNENTRLGIGRSAPSQTLHVAGGILLETTNNNVAGTIRYSSGRHESGNGTTWRPLLQGDGAAVTAGQIAYFSAVNTVINSSNLYWNNANSCLGIGTNLPNEKITIQNALGDARIELRSTNNLAGLILDGGAGGSTSEITFREGGVTNYRGAIGWAHDAAQNYIFIYQGGNALIAKGGKVTIGNNNNPTEVLTVMGNANISGSAFITGNLTVSGTFSNPSDFRYKKNFENLQNPLSKVLKMNGLYYDWRTDEFPQQKFTDTRQIGFIAQELEQIYPELVITDQNGYKSVDYSKTTPILVEAIKEQQGQIEDLKKQVAELQKQMKTLIGLVGQEQGEKGKK